MLRQRPLHRAPQHLLEVARLYGAKRVIAIHDGGNLVAGAESGDGGPDGEHGAGAVGAGDDGRGERPRVLAARHDEVAVVERGGRDCGFAVSNRPAWSGRVMRARFTSTSCGPSAGSGAAVSSRSPSGPVKASMTQRCVVVGIGPVAVGRSPIASGGRGKDCGMGLMGGCAEHGCPVCREGLVDAFGTP